MVDYRLPEQLDIRNIAEVQRALLETLSATGGALLIDAGAVARIDTAGVQLLAAGLRRRPGRVLTLAYPAPALIAAFEGLGLGHLLDLE